MHIAANIGKDPFSLNYLKTNHYEIGNVERGYINHASWTFFKKTIANICQFCFG